MTSPSLQNSPSLKSINEAIQDSLTIREHIQGMNNLFVSSIIELMEEADPKKLLEKSVSARIKLTQDLIKQNQELLQKNAFLEQQLKNLKTENKTLKASLGLIQQIQNQSLIQVNSPSCENGSVEKVDTNGPLFIETFEQNQKMAQIEKKLQNARNQEAKVEQNWQKVMIYLQDVFDRLNRVVEFQKIGKEDVYDEENMTITLRKQKYDLLFDFYTQSRSICTLDKKHDQENGNQVKEFITQENKQDFPSKTANQDWSIDEFEKIFKVLAERNELTIEWENYLKNRQNESEKELTKLKDIASGKNDKNNQAQIDKSESNIKLNQSKSNLNQSDLTTNTEALETTASVIKSEQKQIEACLFKKIRELMKSLNFSQIEFDIFNRFDQKRICQRLFNLDEIIYKFKDKTDLAEISEQFTIYLIKTINSLVVNVMCILIDSDAQNSKKFSWFEEKMNKKSIEVKKRILEVIQKQCNQYMKEKKEVKYKNEGKKSKITPIQHPKFDKQKILENQLAKTVYEYKALLRQSLFNWSKEIRIIL